MEKIRYWRVAADAAHDEPARAVGRDNVRRTLDQRPLRSPLPPRLACSRLVEEPSAARMPFVVASIALAFALFLGMLCFLEIGRRLGRRRLALGPEARAGVGVVEGAVYGLLALLIGFMFSGAADRFQHRRQLVAQQQNAASTAWLRVSLLPADQQPAVRRGFRRYMDALMAFYGSSNSSVLLGSSPELQRAESELFSTAVAACTTSTGESARVLLLPAMNEMFGDVDMERMAFQMHPPIINFRNARHCRHGRERDLRHHRARAS